MIKFIIKAISKIQEATAYSLCGLKAAFQNEFAFRLELLAATIALPCAFFLGSTAIERALLIGTLFIILIAELLNSAIETTLNRIDLAWNPLTKRAKDMGSAAILIAIINAIIIWTIIIFSH
ncbi:diacylglycerol kinase [Legionella longbeachae]|uniref:Diacylglycerol kinase n=1 Tax=Legionella longbeachae serogroup 1 (strain NSW150) TaxID=661367 RepID=D3HM09_LEGLN|nr:diacylglycerol kinase [Legionella longbeachae]VEE03922.1 diacylglycerol kinase [Legionella oakridgensis]HBD7397298.1 diacylglycerol kinase [Legionella pneumophila]ARB93223.1 diacylglycerol kinase [Legionella longbeachae]ARM33713.1 diacylglycerol kinase [Legionella longbeachae]EEZ97133.1 diacylglycerol kinase [Legionella longbeachae D-4968]